MNARNRRHMSRAAKRRDRQEAWKCKDGRRVRWDEFSSRHLENVIKWCERTRLGLSTYSSPTPSKGERDFATLVRDIPKRELARRSRWTEKERHQWASRGIDGADKRARKEWLRDYRELQQERKAEKWAILKGLEQRAMHDTDWLYGDDNS